MKHEVNRVACHRVAGALRQQLAGVPEDVTTECGFLDRNVAFKHSSLRAKRFNARLDVPQTLAADVMPSRLAGAAAAHLGRRPHESPVPLCAWRAATGDRQTHVQHRLAQLYGL